MIRDLLDRPCDPVEVTAKREDEVPEACAVQAAPSGLVAIAPPGPTPTNFAPSQVIAQMSAVVVSGSWFQARPSALVRSTSWAVKMFEPIPTSSVPFQITGPTAMMGGNGFAAVQVSPHVDSAAARARFAANTSPAVAIQSTTASDP